MTMNIETITNIFREKGLLFIRTDSKDQRLEILKILESDGFYMLRKE